ncbi:MAG: hypothetical protein DRH12_03425 [Deltaproteobacteria bacterium]|nr:MAG: hypothetical protein DRH12_03425 [Deltaproteobacteria bacterium]RLB86549.1 MAG: hypothetical protein DRH15_01315 [Deltaproteobacteria bacterium]
MNIQQLTKDIREHYRSNPDRSGKALEQYLEKMLSDKKPEERLAIVKALAKQFSSNLSQQTQTIGEGGPILERLFSRVLGERLPDKSMPTHQMAERLAEALNTVFDSLNQLVRGINMTLMGNQPLGDETIRFVIGSQMTGASSGISLKEYINQIKEAFSIAHRAFQEAAKTKFKEILSELDPEKLEKNIEGGIKFGPLRKAELFDIYKEKFRTLKNWLETGLLMEATMREFEKTCQKLYSDKGGTK